MKTILKVQSIALVLLLLCSVCIAPVMAQEPIPNRHGQESGWSEGHGWYIDPESGILTKLNREFTFCDDSISGGYRLPDGARILYAEGYTVVWDKTGKLIANISDENAGPWFGPNPKQESTHNAPLSLEVPSGSYVFHEDNRDTIIARDLDKADIINKYTFKYSEIFPPNEKGSAENKKPFDGHSWVTWYEIPLVNPITKLVADWRVEITPQLYETTTSPKSDKEDPRNFHAFHIFPGINTDNHILQPVLSRNWAYYASKDPKWGSKRDPIGNNQWTISSHICGVEGDVHTESHKISTVKDVPVHGEIVYNRAFNPPYWTITTSQGTVNAVLNHVYESNPPTGKNPSIVFTLEKQVSVMYPKASASWTRVHWPDDIIFKNIVIEPGNSIDTNKARAVVACSQPECSAVEVPKTQGDINNGIIITFKPTTLKPEDNPRYDPL